MDVYLDEHDKQMVINRKEYRMKDIEIVYSEPDDYFLPETRKIFFEDEEKKPTIDDFKDRMTSPISAVRIDPETRKPI